MTGEEYKQECLARMPIKDLAKRFGIHKHTLYSRFKKGGSIRQEWVDQLLEIDPVNVLPVPKANKIPRGKFDGQPCEIKSRLELPGGDILLRVQRIGPAAAYWSYLIWDTQREILRCPFAHPDDRAEVMGWDTDPETIMAVAAWTVDKELYKGWRKQIHRAYGIKVDKNEY